MSAVLIHAAKLSFSFFLCLVVFFLTLFVYTQAAGPLPFRVDSISTQKSDSFMVNGTGKSSIKPDKGTVRLGVTATGKTAEEAKSKMNEIINKVSAAIKGVGVTANDIKTENFSVYPNYNEIKPMTMEAPEISIAPAPPGAPRDTNAQATSYTANTNLVITVRQVDLANKVLDTASSNGANQMGGVEFGSTDTTVAENDARTKAIADAKQKAQTAAEAAGFRLGKLVNYQESNGGGPIMYDRAMSMNAAAEGSAPTQLETGENEVSVTVTLSYEVL